MSPHPRHAQVLLVGLAALVATGCHRQTAQAASPAATAGGEAPAPGSGKPNDTPSAKEGNATAAPSTPSDTEATAPASKPPALKVPEPSKPAPKPPATAPATQPAPESSAPRPVPPLISPRVPPAQQSERRQQTEKSISVAEANLHHASGRTLNDAQHDMSEKIRNLITQAREAGEVPDWERAFVLAEKARVLSEELVNSLASPQE